MHNIELKEQVRQSIHSQWQTFATDHPNLAAVVDEQLLVEQVCKNIADDPAYVRAMSQAQVVGTAAQTGLDLIQRLVTRFLWGLV